MTTLLLCPRCGASHNGDEEECVLCYRATPASTEASPVRHLTAADMDRTRDIWSKIASGFVDRLVIDGQVFERNRGWIYPHWLTRGRGRHKHLEGMGTDLRKANIDLLEKICVFEMRELLGCHEGPKSPTDWNLRHRKARGMNLEDWIDGEIEKEDR